eukprot:670115-Amphidinium_carterae.1
MKHQTDQHASEFDRQEIRASRNNAGNRASKALLCKHMTKERVSADFVLDARVRGEAERDVACENWASQHELQRMPLTTS